MSSHFTAIQRLRNAADAVCRYSQAEPGGICRVTQRKIDVLADAVTMSAGIGDVPQPPARVFRFRDKLYATEQGATRAAEAALRGYEKDTSPLSKALARLVDAGKTAEALSIANEAYRGGWVVVAEEVQS